METIVFIGSGNIATHLAKELYTVGHPIAQIYSRNLDHARELAEQVDAEICDDLSAIDTNCEVYVICVKDDATAEVAAKLKIAGKYVLHTSGSLPLEILANTSENHGVLYPLQTLSKGTYADFREIPICIEASNRETLRVISGMASSITKSVINMNSQQRRSVHLAAVFACNFTNEMYRIASELLKENNIPLSVLFPLITETSNRLRTGKSPKELRTGPASRGDQHVMNTHLELLNNHPEYRKLYEILSESIMKS